MIDSNKYKLKVSVNYFFSDGELNKVLQASFRGAELQNVSFKNAKLDGANFHKAELKNIDFQGVDLTKVKGIASIIVKTIMDKNAENCTNKHL